MKYNNKGTFLKSLIALLFMFGIGINTVASADVEESTNRWNDAGTEVANGIVDSYIRTELAKGGAIYYTSDDYTLPSITGTFTGNYAYSTVAGNNALGGAIYTTKNLTIEGNATFSGNYTQTDGGSKLYRAIFMDTTNGQTTLTLNSRWSSHKSEYKRRVKYRILPFVW